MITGFYYGSYCGLAMPSKGFYSTSVSVCFNVHFLYFTFNFPLKPLLGIAFVINWPFVLVNVMSDIYHADFNQLLKYSF